MGGERRGENGCGEGGASDGLMQVLHTPLTRHLVAALRLVDAHICSQPTNKGGGEVGGTEKAAEQVWYLIEEDSQTELEEEDSKTAQARRWL